MILRCITPPSHEPVTLADVEGQARIADLSNEAAVIGIFIEAVRQRAEAITRRAFVTQVHEMTLDGFPYGRNAITLPLPPLQSVVSIKYTDATGAEQTLDPLAYRVIADAEPGYVLPVYGLSWPGTLNDAATVRIRFVCGYGPIAPDTADNVPAAIKQFILMNVASLYENRESQTVASGRLTEVDLSSLADGLLDNYRVHGW